MTSYLDCNATTPLEPEVADIVAKYTVDEFGNAGSRTHQFGARAKRAVEKARSQVATVVAARPEEVVFTSGATESNNLAILGLAEAGLRAGKRHVISTQIEHKSVLEPLAQLEKLGFAVELMGVSASGRVNAERVLGAVRPDTLLISVMHVNNETGVVQPITAIADALNDRDCFFHVDAAQGFGKRLEDLLHPRIDLISISAHKIYGPKGVGALVVRRRNFKRPPLKPLIFGGGQEYGLRPGTLPVPLIAGLGAAASLASEKQAERERLNQQTRQHALAELRSLGIKINGDEEYTVPHTLNCQIPGVDAEAAMVALKDIAAISNGSACTSSSYAPSHVLKAMGLSDGEIGCSLRFSWSHLTTDVDWRAIRDALAALQ